jgi:hypothetical protein
MRNRWKVLLRGRSRPQTTRLRDQVSISSILSVSSHSPTDMPAMRTSYNGRRNLHARGVSLAVTMSCIVDHSDERYLRKDRRRNVTTHMHLSSSAAF